MKASFAPLVVALASISPAARAAGPLDLVPLLDRSPRHPLADATGRVAVTVAVPPGADARALGLLPIAPGLATVRLAPSEIPAFVAAHPGLRASVRPKLRPVMDRATVLTNAGAFRERTGGDGSGVIVGIVDTGIDATHPDFLDANGKTRIAWLLDFSQQPLGRHAEMERAYGCDDPVQAPCAVLSATDIDLALANIEAVPVPHDQVGHGTHVASIAAGDGADGAGVGRYAGIAPRAAIVAVRATTDGGDGFTDTDIVQGCRFVFDRARELELPAVVNVSIGSDYGAHAGTSALEQGMAALVGPDQPGRAIVVAAGNSGALYANAAADRLGTHATVRVAPGDRMRVRVLSPSPAGGSVTGAVDAWVATRPGETISVGLDGPDGRWIEQVAPGDSGGFSPAGGGLSAAVLNGVTDDPAATAATASNAVVMWSGTWAGGSELAITLEGDGTADVWIEGSDGAGPSAGTPGVLLYGASKEGTVNVPATHPDLIAVGCTLDRASWKDHTGALHELASFGGAKDPVADSACYFSGAGPTATGVMKPDVSAPGALVAAAMGRDQVPGKGRSSIFEAAPGTCETGASDCLVVDAHHALLSGTSMSAPMVAGAIALLLQQQPTLTQPALRALLQAGARLPAGAVPYDWQLGPGALDVEGAATVLAAHGDPLLAPGVDPARSWMALSTGYARPDAALPVEGTIEVRTRDGGIADGFDVSRLSLAVEGGDVVRPLARVAPGLFQFAVVATPGGGAAALSIRAAWDGTTIGAPGSAYGGERTLPIAVDPYLARGAVAARGGCATRAPSGGGGAPAAALAIALTAWRASRSRRAARTARPRGRTAG